jgi:hypothetical protein
MRNAALCNGPSAMRNASALSTNPYMASCPEACAAFRPRRRLVVVACLPSPWAAKMAPWLPLFEGFANLESTCAHCNAQGSLPRRGKSRSNRPRSPCELSASMSSSIACDCTPACRNFLGNHNALGPWLLREKSAFAQLVAWATPPSATPPSATPPSATPHPVKTAGTRSIARPRGPTHQPPIICPPGAIERACPTCPEGQCARPRVVARSPRSARILERRQPVAPAQSVAARPRSLPILVSVCTRANLCQVGD